MTARPTDRDLAHRLRELAGEARRLPPPNHRNPDAFHEARSELGHQLELLARSIDSRSP